MKKLLVGVLALACLGGGVAWATHLPQADPKDVPYGALAAGIQVKTPFKIKVGSERSHRLRGAVAFVRHLQFEPNGSSGWHTHPGPALVTIVRGSLTLYAAPRGDDDHDDEGDDDSDGDDGRCTSVTYHAGEGFIDPGFGHVHLAIAGAEGTDFYQTILLPPEQADTLATNVTAPKGRDCPAS